LHLIEARVDAYEDVDRKDGKAPFIEARGRTSPVIMGGGFLPDNSKGTVNILRPDDDMVVMFARWFTTSLIWYSKHDYF
jgi:NADPH2 dehydrogenase